jgi:hypothetical protein
MLTMPRRFTVATDAYTDTRGVRGSAISYNFAVTANTVEFSKIRAAA